jgi:hypothetical protein
MSNETWYGNQRQLASGLKVIKSESLDFLERGPLSLVTKIEELLERKVANPVLKAVNTTVGILHADHVAPSLRKDWCRSVGIVHSLTQATEFRCFYLVSCGRSR